MEKASNFTLEDQDGKSHSLKDYLGSWVLVYFYPKDDTPGCTKEACGIRDEWSAFKKAGIKVFGISADSVIKHKKFVDKYTLPFTLLSDPDHIAIGAFGVWKKKKFMGREYMGISRESFLINPKGVVVKHYEKVKPADHASEILADVAKISK